MPPKRKRSSKNAKEEDQNQLQSHTANDIEINDIKIRFNRIEELLISVNKEVLCLRNENKDIKETIREMKSEIQRIDDVSNPSPLWKLVTEWRDVFEREVLTKLNRTEQKLFSQTCRASREAVRRAKMELRDKFWISELSSISQLELAWANYEWGSKGKYANGKEYTRNQEQFCARVAGTNDLALLRWVRGVKECAWDYKTSGRAAILGNLEMLKYCVENGCEVGPGTCADAAENGHLECLKYLHEKNVKWSHRTVQLARENNHVDCLNYALANNCPQTREEFQALQLLALQSDSDSEEEEDSEEDSEEEEEEA
jgi:hypothetical protein